MKHKYSILMAIAAALVMGALWCVVFTRTLGSAGIRVGILFGIAFGCCGFLFGRSLDRARHEEDRNTKDEDDTQ